VTELPQPRRDYRGNGGDLADFGDEFVRFGGPIKQERWGEMERTSREKRGRVGEAVYGSRGVGEWATG
jgi:hypothetical protein